MRTTTTPTTTTTSIALHRGRPDQQQQQHHHHDDTTNMNMNILTYRLAATVIEDGLPSTKSISPICCICSQKYKKGTILSCLQPCNHQFHAKCIYQWFNTRQKRTCPICRIEITITTSTKQPSDKSSSSATATTSTTDLLSIAVATDSSATSNTNGNVDSPDEDNDDTTPPTDTTIEDRSTSTIDSGALKHYIHCLDEIIEKDLSTTNINRHHDVYSSSKIAASWIDDTALFGDCGW